MRETDESIKDMTSTMKECLRLLDNGYLTTVAVKIKTLAVRLDNDGLGTPLKELIKRSTRQ